MFLFDDVAEWVIPQDVHRLVIVPDGLLSRIPFDLLIPAYNGEKYIFATQPYLLKHYSIAYEPSAHLYILQSNKKVDRAPSVFAGFAPKYETPETSAAIYSTGASSERGDIYELKGAVKEVRTAVRLFRGQEFIYEEASEAIFKEKAGNYRIILLAMHALLNISNPAFSKLMFTKNASGDKEDDQLYAIELSEMQFFSELAILSACNTGYGKIQEGEGVMNLSRAFFASGVPSTVVTLWSIPDGTSSDIVVRFCKLLKAGLPKDIALQKAKLGYLKKVMKEAKQEEKLDPYYWAGFIVAGNQDPIEGLGFSSHPPLLYAILAALGILALLLFRYKTMRDGQHINS